MAVIVKFLLNYMITVMEKRVVGQLSPGRVFAWILDMKHLFEKAPRRTEIIMDKLANDQITVRLEVAHFDQAVKTINKAANRLSLSIIAASLIIGGKFVWDNVQERPRKSKKR